MANLSKIEAKQRADQILAFQAELAELQDHSVLTLSEGQQQAIQRYHNDMLASYSNNYDIDHELSEKQSSWRMRVALLLGALALAAGTVFFLYQS